MKALRWIPLFLILALLLAACGAPAGGAPQTGDAPEKSAGEAAPAPEAAQEEGLIRPAWRAKVLTPPEALKRPEQLTLAGDTLYVYGSGALFAADSKGENWRQIQLQPAPLDMVTAMAAWEGKVFFLENAYEPAGEEMVARESLLVYDAESGEQLINAPLDQLADAAPTQCLAAEGRLAIAVDEALYLYSAEGEPLGRTELPGPALFLSGTPEGPLVCADTGEQAKPLFRLDMESGALEALGAIDGEETPELSYLSQDGAFWAGMGGLWSLEPESGAGDKLLSWADLCVSVYNVSGFCRTAAGDFFLADGWGGLIYRISPYDGPALKEIKVASLGGGYTFVTQAVARFNSASTEYYVSYQAYGMDERERFLTELNSGKGPDILLQDSTTNSESVMTGQTNEVNIRNGLLADLLPLIDADKELSREDFVPGVLESMTEGGGLYRLAPSFQLNSITAPETLTKTLDGWDMETLTALGDTLPENAALFSSWRREFFMDELCAFASVAYVDYDAMACHFDDPSFAAWLELTGSQTFLGDLPDDAQGTAVGLLNDGTVFPSGLTMYTESGENYEYLGFPGREGASSYLSCEVSSFSILNASGNKEGAWAFLRQFLTPETQSAISSVGFGLPVMAADYDAYMRSVLEKNSEQGLTQEDIDRFTAQVAGNAGMARGTLVSSMIKEEAEKYFAGQQTLEKTVELLQSKARLYLAEQS